MSDFFGLSMVPVNALGRSHVVEPEPDPPAPGVRDREILAWREWELGPQSCLGRKANEVRLTSTVYNTVWPGPTLVADRVPTRSNCHGIHAVKGRKVPPVSAHSVFGVVALSGRVIEHEFGYRAERATVRAVYVPHAYHHVTDEVLAALATHYQCRVKRLREGVRERTTRMSLWQEAAMLAAAFANLRVALEAYAQLAGLADRGVLVMRYDERYVVARPVTFGIRRELVSVASFYDHPHPLSIAPTTRLDVQADVIAQSHGAL